MKKLVFIYLVILVCSCKKEPYCRPCERIQQGIQYCNFNYIDTITVCDDYKPTDTMKDGLMKWTVKIKCK
jgi:hypothetical protein